MEKLLPIFDFFYNVERTKKLYYYCHLPYALTEGLSGSNGSVSLDSSLVSAPLEKLVLRGIASSLCLQSRSFLLSLRIPP